MSSSGKAFSCDFCDATFDCLRKLSKHVLLDHPTSDEENETNTHSNVQSQNVGITPADLENPHSQSQPPNRSPFRMLSQSSSSQRKRKAATPSQSDQENDTPVSAKRKRKSSDTKPTTDKNIPAKTEPMEVEGSPTEKTSMSKETTQSAKNIQAASRSRNSSITVLARRLSLTDLAPDSQFSIQFLLNQWMLDKSSPNSKRLLEEGKMTSPSLILFDFLQGRNIGKAHHSRIAELLVTWESSEVWKPLMSLLLISYCLSKSSNELVEIKQRMRDLEVSGYFIHLIHCIQLFVAANVPTDFYDTTSFRNLHQEVRDCISERLQQEIVNNLENKNYGQRINFLLAVVKTIETKLVAEMNIRNGGDINRVKCHYSQICHLFFHSLLLGKPLNLFEACLKSSCLVNNGTFNIECATSDNDIVISVHKEVLEMQGIKEPKMFKKWDLTDLNLIQVTHLLEVLYKFFFEPRGITISKPIICGLQKLGALETIQSLVQDKWVFEDEGTKQLAVSISGNYAAENPERSNTENEGAGRDTSDVEMEKEFPDVEMKKEFPSVEMEKEFPDVQDDNPHVEGTAEDEKMSVDDDQSIYDTIAKQIQDVPLMSKVHLGKVKDLSQEGFFRVLQSKYFSICDLKRCELLIGWICHKKEVRFEDPWSAKLTEISNGDYDMLFKTVDFSKLSQDKLQHLSRSNFISLQMAMKILRKINKKGRQTKE